MKLLFVCLLSTLLFSGCKKDDQKQTGEPVVSLSTTKCTAFGGGRNIEFVVNIETNGTALNKLELYKSSTKITELTTPQSGVYTLYHTVSVCPVQSDNAMYHFVIIKQDGGQISTTPFQVAF
jgi:hypothetical protein